MGEVMYDEDNRRGLQTPMEMQFVRKPVGAYDHHAYVQYAVDAKENEYPRKRAWEACFRWLFIFGFFSDHLL